MAFIHLVDTPVTIDGYTFSPLTLADMGDFVLYFQFYDCHVAEEATRNFPPDARKKILAEEYERCRKMKLPIWEVKRNDEGAIIEKIEVDETRPVFEHPYVQEFSTTMPGIVYQMYLSLRHHHKDITLEKSREICTPKLVAEVQSKLMGYLDDLQERIEKEMELGLGET